MLCTPPAFILSQDQTLEKFLSYPSFRSVTTFSSSSFVASFTLLSIYNSIWRDLYFRTSQCFVQSLLLFNFQWPFASRSCGQPDYYTTSLLLCQALFLIFLKLFFSRSLSVKTMLARLTATRILYPFSGVLSSRFLEVCRLFSFLIRVQVFYWHFFIYMLQ